MPPLNIYKTGKEEATGRTASQPDYFRLEEQGLPVMKQRLASCIVSTYGLPKGAEPLILAILEGNEADSNSGKLLQLLRDSGTDVDRLAKMMGQDLFVVLYPGVSGPGGGIKDAGDFSSTMLYMELLNPGLATLLEGLGWKGEYAGTYVISYSEWQELKTLVPDCPLSQYDGLVNESKERGETICIVASKEGRITNPLAWLLPPYMSGEGTGIDMNTTDPAILQKIIFISSIVDSDLEEHKEAHDKFHFKDGKEREKKEKSALMWHLVELELDQNDIPGSEQKIIEAIKNWVPDEKKDKVKTGDTKKDGTEGTKKKETVNRSDEEEYALYKQATKAAYHFNQLRLNWSLFEEKFGPMETEDWLDENKVAELKGKLQEFSRKLYLIFRDNQEDSNKDAEMFKKHLAGVVFWIASYTKSDFAPNFKIEAVTPKNWTEAVKKLYGEKLANELANANADLSEPLGEGRRVTKPFTIEANEERLKWAREVLGKTKDDPTAILGRFDLTTQSGVEKALKWLSGRTLIVADNSPEQAEQQKKSILGAIGMLQIWLDVTYGSGVDCNVEIKTATYGDYNGFRPDPKNASDEDWERMADEMCNPEKWSGGKMGTWLNVYKQHQTERQIKNMLIQVVKDKGYAKGWNAGGETSKYWYWTPE